MLGGAPVVPAGAQPSRRDEGVCLHKLCLIMTNHVVTQMELGLDRKRHHGYWNHAASRPGRVYFCFPTFFGNQKSPKSTSFSETKRPFPGTTGYSLEEEIKSAELQMR